MKRFVLCLLGAGVITSGRFCRSWLFRERNETSSSAALS